MSESSSHLIEAESLYAQGEYDLAGLHFQMALIEAPDNPVIYYHLGILSLKTPLEAIALFKQALELNPSYGECHFELGRLTFYQKSFEVAIDHLETAIKLMPAHVMSYYYLGFLYREVGLTLDAVRTLQAYIQLQPNHYEVHLELGHMYSYLGYKDKAAESYLEASGCHEEKGVEALGYWLEVISESKINRKIEFFIEMARAFPEHKSILALQVAMMMEENGEAEEARKCVVLALEDPALTNRAIWELKSKLMSPRILMNEKAQSEVTAQLDSFFESSESLELSPILPDLENIWPYLTCWKPFLFLPEYNMPLKLRVDFDRFFTSLLSDTKSTQRETLRTDKRRMGVFMYNHPSEFLTLSPLLASLADQNIEVILIYEDQFSHSTLPSYMVHSQSSVLILQDEFKYHVEQVLAMDLDFLYFSNLRINSLKQTHLAAYRLAPIQFTSWYMNGSSGRKQIDYYISSEHMPYAQVDFSETLVKLPGLPAVFPALPMQSLQLTRADYSLPETGSLILCPYFFTAYRYDFDKVIETLLKRDSESMIVFLDKPPGSGLHHVLLERFENEMPELMPQIWFLPYLTDEQEYNLFALSDLILEPPVGDIHVSYWAYSLGIPLVSHWSDYSIACAFHHRAGINTPKNESEYINTCIALLDSPNGERESMHTAMLNPKKPIIEDLTFAQSFAQFLNEFESK